MQLISQTLIHWIEIYPVDSAIQRLNNQSLDSRIWEIFASGIQKPEDFCFRNLESWALKSISQLTESGIPPPIGIQIQV